MGGDGPVEQALAERRPTGQDLEGGALQGMLQFVDRDGPFSVPQAGQLLAALTTLGVGVAFEVQVDVPRAGCGQPEQAGAGSRGEELIVRGLRLRSRTCQAA